MKNETRFFAARSEAGSSLTRRLCPADPRYPHLAPARNPERRSCGGRTRCCVCRSRTTRAAPRRDSDVNSEFLDIFGVRNERVFRRWTEYSDGILGFGIAGPGAEGARGPRIILTIGRFRREHPDRHIQLLDRHRTWRELISDCPDMPAPPVRRVFWPLLCSMEKSAADMSLWP